MIRPTYNIRIGEDAFIDASLYLSHQVVGIVNDTDRAVLLWNFPPPVSFFCGKRQRFIQFDLTNIKRFTKTGDTGYGTRGLLDWIKFRSPHHDPV